MQFDVYIACRFDLLDICINGPKEKLDSTVISQVLTGFFDHFQSSRQ